MIKAKITLFYAAMLGAALGLFFWIRSAGDSLLAPAGLGRFAHGGRAESGGVLTHVLLALVVIILCARALGSVFRRFNQPPVIGEMIAGILLGPSLLGRVLPGVSAYLLPNEVAPFVSVIANVGVILYMFLVGVELNTDLLRERTHASVAISHASIIAPFLLGSALALWLYPVFSTNDVPFVVFALFMGVAMSVTAFPVLARILTDRQTHTSRMGAIALACAAVDDVTAWCLFALVVSVAKAHAGRVLVTLGLTAGFIFAVFILVRPAAVWFARQHDLRRQTGQGSIVVACAALLLAALTTQRIGIHALFGAFLVGAVIPHDSLLARDIKQKFEDLIVVLFLPTFFAFTGLRTQIGLVHGLRDWLICLLIIGVASLGKFGGGAVAARLTGLGWRQAASLGILMNTRGLMELIVLNVGMDLGVLSPTLFAMLVIMAIVTTLATTPVLQMLRKTPQLVAVEEAV
ncbi:MAG TPA: cation:proton antiporter [Terriglobia bacterium]|nr:cation:proton antiporter [Terriglobia bacterium]